MGVESYPQPIDLRGDQEGGRRAPSHENAKINIGGADAIAATLMGEIRVNNSAVPGIC